MNLTKALGLKLGQTEVVLVGIPTVTSIMSKEKNEPYYLAKLKTPITVRCSTNKDIEAFETDEVYIRESALNEEGWDFVDATKPELGFSMKNWVVDFSINQEIPIYQPETISQWSKGNRVNRRDENTKRINSSLREKIKKS